MPACQQEALLRSGLSDIFSSYLAFRPSLSAGGVGWELYGPRTPGRGVQDAEDTRDPRPGVIGAQVMGRWGGPPPPRHSSESLVFFPLPAAKGFPFKGGALGGCGKYWWKNPSTMPVSHTQSLGIQISHWCLSFQAFLLCGMNER